MLCCMKSRAVSLFLWLISSVFYSVFLFYLSSFNLSLCVYRSHSLPLTHKLSLAVLPPTIKQEGRITDTNISDVCMSVGLFSLSASLSLYKKDKPINLKGDGRIRDGEKKERKRRKEREGSFGWVWWESSSHQIKLPSPSKTY